MDEKEQDRITAFDLLFTNNQIQIMKILLPCFSPSIQKYLAIYIKYQELHYTLSYFQNTSLHTEGFFNEKSKNIKDLLPVILPYCNESQKKMLKQLDQLFSSLESYQEIMEMMEMMQAMQDTSEDHTDGNDSNSPFSGQGIPMPDIEAMLSMLSPKQQELIELLKGGMNDE